MSMIFLKALLIQKISKLQSDWEDLQDLAEFEFEFKLFLNLQHLI